jgi:hypothetical protein
MKAPKYQRMEALEAAIQTAGHHLSGPIEGLEVTRDGIVAWAGGRAILMSYGWNQSYSEDGSPYLGSGHWSAEYVRDCAVPSGETRKTSRWWPWRLPKAPPPGNAAG